MRWLLALLVLTITSFTVGCGRFAPPIAPELIAPGAIRLFVVKTDDTGVLLSWKSSLKDGRGKELQSIDGYRIYRKLINKQSDITDQKVKFDLLATLRDLHVEEREKRRAEARALGKPGRRIQASAETQAFEYLDSTPTVGETYLYQIVPFNQEDVESLSPQSVLILFSGIKSQVTPITSQLTDTTSDDPLNSL